MHLCRQGVTADGGSRLGRFTRAGKPSPRPRKQKKLNPSIITSSVGRTPRTSMNMTTGLVTAFCFLAPILVPLAC
jgi:hypothetical protein